ncbi:hypothetical protein V5O48_015960 [Marasmius crinis-equi]|uniref:Uncharacterized protein n=1 Tax=Marasmius crinis-equi TaxID=585013 RepID=A0ABR3ET29_9AGAR
MGDSEDTSAFPTINFGNGLVEIAALTTLIGSSTAGDLVLGNGGAAGLVWGSISAFGSSSVIKACASAGSPGWLRQMLGLRTAFSDRAVGMDLSLAPRNKVARRIRGTMEESGPLGVSCLSDDPDGTPMEKSPKVKEHHTYRDIYAFDGTTSLMLSELSSTPPEYPPVIYTHYPYAFYRSHYLRFQILVLCFSLLKSVEMYTLFVQGGIILGLLSGVPFIFAFTSALSLEAHDIISSRRPVEVDGRLDIVAASPLPTTKESGGPRKIVLGASPRQRTGPWWKFFWATTGIIQTITVVLSYLTLGQKRSEVVFVWAGFQLFWLVARILIFNLTENTHPMANRPLKSNKLESLPLSMKLRVASLVLGVGRYQSYVHPRRIDAYMDDSFSTRQIARLLSPENMGELYPLQAQLSLKTLGSSPSLTSLSSSSSLSISSEKILSTPTARSIKVNILAVIGDTALSSAAWMLGNAKYAPMDLYDSCIVVFEVPSALTTLNSIGSAGPTPRIIAVPAARAFSTRSHWLDVVAAGREEGMEPVFVARGAGSQVTADEKTWIYWVPCEGGEWLQLTTSPSRISLAPETLPKSFSSIQSMSSQNTRPGFRLGSASAKVQSILGHQVAEIMDDKELSRFLGAGKLNISIKHASEVRGVVEISRRANEALLAFLR